MSSFVSRPPPPAQDSPSLVQNDGFWPDLDLQLLRSDARIDTVITAERLREAAIEALIDANAELAAWRAAQIDLGYTTLDQVPQTSIGGEKVKVATYRRAIHSLVAADLIDRQGDIAATKAGLERSEELRTAGDDHRRNYRWAVSDLLGIGRTTVELI